MTINLDRFDNLRSERLLVRESKDEVIERSGWERSQMLRQWLRKLKTKDMSDTHQRFGQLQCMFEFLQMEALQSIWLLTFQSFEVMTCISLLVVLPIHIFRFGLKHRERFHQIQQKKEAYRRAHQSRVAGYLHLHKMTLVVFWRGLGGLSDVGDMFRRNAQTLSQS